MVTAKSKRWSVAYITDGNRQRQTHTDMYTDKHTDTHSNQPLNIGFFDEGEKCKPIKILILILKI